MQDLVGHTNKEVKEVAIEIMIEIYKLSQDDASAFIRNLKSLRPIQLKEIKDMLQDIVKLPNTVNLFAKDYQDSNKDGLTPKKQKSTKLVVEEQVLSNRDLDDDAA
jgi:beta-glucosidase-like glycosyl hydrolase